MSWKKISMTILGRIRNGVISGSRKTQVAVKLNF